MSKPTVAPDPSGSSGFGASLPHIRALDGLRALAVIAVLVYHHFVGQSIDTATGGFLGVDVFFVLSGFLITALLLIDDHRFGRAISWRFWERRARRLLPALLVFLLVIGVYAVVWAPNYRLEAIRRSSFATLLYSQNYFQLYGGAAGRAPLSHTWSLAIEEQFYFLWPIALAAILALTHRRRSGTIAVIAAGIVASAAMMAWKFDPSSPWRAYLGLDTRAHQLLVGALLAVVLRGLPQLPRAKVRALEILAFAAIAWLGWLVLHAHFSTPWLYRGGFLLVSIGTAVIIAATTQRDARVLHAVLGWRPLAAIGTVSYGLYLFHIPVYYVVSPDRMEDLSGPRLFAARIAVTGALAIGSYVLVEQPIRRRATWLPPMKIVAPVALAAVIATVLVGTRSQEPLPPSLTRYLAYYRYATGTPVGSARVLVAGDAFAVSLGSGTTDGSYTADSIRGVTAAVTGCGLASGAIVAGTVSFPAPRCGAQIDVFLNVARIFSPDVVVYIAGVSEVYDRRVDGKLVTFGSDEFERFLTRRLDDARNALTSAGARMLVLTTPCMTPDVGGQFGTFAPARRDPARIAWLNSFWERYARANDDVDIADLNAFVCDENGERLIDAGGESFGAPDGVAFSPTGAQAIWAWLAPLARAAVGPEPVDKPRPFLE